MKVENTGLGALAPTSAKYVTAQAESGLSAEVNLGALTTGILKHTVSGGVSTPATATPGTDYYNPGGTDVAIADGGTGTSTAPSDGKLLIGKTDGSYNVANLTAGTNVTITNGNGSIEIAASGGGGSGPSIIDFNSTQVGNSAGAETDLKSKSVAGGTLANDGETIEFEAAGTLATSFDADAFIKVKWGATTIFSGDPIIQTLSNNKWSISGTIIRTGATTQKCFVRLTYGQEPGTFGWAANSASFTDYEVAGETLSGASTLKITGSGTTANDVVCEFWKVKKWPAS